mgnify:CR=1 FL=1
MSKRSAAKRRTLSEEYAARGLSESKFYEVHLSELQRFYNIIAEHAKIRGRDTVGDEWSKVQDAVERHVFDHTAERAVGSDSKV